MTYWLPDYNNILQEFLWQTNDVVPTIPRVHKFLHYWKRNIDATINTIEVSYVSKSKVRQVDIIEELQ